MDASVTASTPHAWTPEDKTRVAELLRQGRSAGQIARQFPPTTRNAIIGVVHRDRELRQIGFANGNRGNPKLKPPTKKQPVMTHKPENRFAALVKPRLVNARPDPEPRRKKPTCGKPVATQPKHIPMVDIGANQCRFPMWVDGDGPPDWLMCGAATQLERSYCAGHAVKVFQARER